METTITDQKVRAFCVGHRGLRFEALFTILREAGLKPLGKSNTDTLLFQFTSADGVDHDVVAFRKVPKDVLSFPKSYWQPRSGLRAEFCSVYSSTEKPETSSRVGSASQQSAAEIELSSGTLERLKVTCRDICDLVIATHSDSAQ
jgi:hypothetical protein